MMKPLFAALAIALFAGGCKKGDGLVFVTVTATPRLTSIARLHVDMTVGATHRSLDIKGVSTIDGSGATTFGIDVSASYGSSITVDVQALDAAGARLAAGAGTAKITPGKQTNIAIALSGAVVHGGDDMAGAAGADLAGVPPCIFDNQSFDDCVLGP